MKLGGIPEESKEETLGDGSRSGCDARALGLPWQLRHQGKMKCRSVDDTSRRLRMSVIELRETRAEPWDKQSFHMGVSTNAGTPKSSIFLWDFPL